MHLDNELELPSSIVAASEERKFSRYLVWTSAVFVGGTLLATLAVLIVDPYHLFRFVDVVGFNRLKPRPDMYREQIKLVQAEALRPNLLLLGNSRVEVGLDPGSPTLRERSYSAYNLGLAGTSLATANNMLDEMRAAVPPPASSIVGLEFLDFLVDPAKLQALPNKVETAFFPLEWRLETVFSLKAVMDTVHTLRLQKTSDPETMTTRGHTPLFEYNKAARYEGYYNIFRQRGQENAKATVRRPHSLYAAQGQPSASMVKLRRMLSTMAQDGTEVHLLIYPYHAELMAMFGATGLDAIMDEWKSVLVSEIDTVRKQFPDARIMLWDFSGYGPVQCQAIPRRGDTRTVTQFYWEAGHFKTSVGELIFERILDKRNNFGFALTASNLEENRQRIAAEREQCHTLNPQIFAEARSMIDAARK